jgi:three-Cys-motif partner protein
MRLANRLIPPTPRWAPHMSQSDDHFAEFPPHTRFKHRVLTSYFNAWGRILLQRRNAGNCVLYVDACAGRGADDAGNHGSPVLAAGAASEAATHIGAIRDMAVNVQVVAIEKRLTYFKQLQKNLEPYRAHARALQGTLTEHLDAINAEFPEAPKLYFIDPFGLEPLNGATVRRALEGPKNEVLVLFADMAAIRHFGAATSEDETKAERALAKLSQTDSLFPEMDEQDRRALEPLAAESRDAQERTRAVAIDILDAVFQNHDWLAHIEPIPRGRRRAAFVELYKQFLVSCGATYVLPFPVYDPSGQLKYHLVHASKSARGHEEMKDAISEAVKNGPLGEEMGRKIMAATSCDVTAVVGQIVARFASQRVRWAQDKSNPVAPFVKAFALQETCAMPWDLDDLKRRLAVYRLPKTGNTILFDFPPIS